jgi:hypothetical protein
MNATDATDVAEAQPLWMGVLGVCLGITGSFFSTLSLLIIKWSTTKERVITKLGEGRTRGHFRDISGKCPGKGAHGLSMIVGYDGSGPWAPQRSPRIPARWVAGWEAGWVQ